MQDKKRMTTRLKELFERPEIFVLAGGMNAMGAKMAEVLGFEAFYMSGGNTSAQLMGWTEGGTSMRDRVAGLGAAHRRQCCESPQDRQTCSRRH